MNERDRRLGRQLLEKYARTRDPRIRDALFVLYRPLADSVVYRFAPYQLDREDLKQEAYRALVDAIERFNPDFGTLFETFAVPTILGNLKRYLRDHGWAVNVPRSLVDLAYQVQKRLPELREKLGRDPSIKEIAAELGVQEDDLAEVLAVMAAKNTSSIDREISSDSDTTGEELIGLLQERNLEDEALLEISIDQLPEPEKFIIRKRLDGLSQSEIAKLLNISQAQVSRFERRAVERLKEAIRG
ncbi:sigma-70 family RNA polymerase sigma factor [Coprothermobacteraceae bacterium]|nr:sigma-70 family RNA polymerase sigma factor [Coprothermobacteraceae bacterium]